MTFTAFERSIFIVNDFDVTFEVAAAGEPGVAKVTSVWSFMGVRL